MQKSLFVLAALALPLVVGCTADLSTAEEGPIDTQASAVCATLEPKKVDSFSIVSIQKEGREVRYVELTRSERAGLDLAATHLERTVGAAEAKCHAGNDASGHFSWACSNGQTYCLCIHFSDGPSCSCQKSTNEC